MNFIFNIFGVQTSLFPAVETSGQTFNQPLWFVSVVLVCYLCFYLWMVKVKEEQKPYYLAGAMILSLWVILNAPMGNRLPLLNVWTAKGLFHFSLGILAVKFSRKQEKIRKENMLLMGAVFVWMFCAFWKKEILGNVDITFSFLAAVPLCILCMQCAAVQKCLEFPIFRWMGKISYSIYIWNFPVQIVFLGVAEVFGAMEFSSPGIWFLNFGVTVMTAYISYKKVECKEQILWDIVKEKK